MINAWWLLLIVPVSMAAGAFCMALDAVENKKNLERAMSGLGDFGKLFLDYDGCPRGAMGRSGIPLEAEVLQMPELTDVDGGVWIPVNADALHELVDRYIHLNAHADPESSL